MQGLTTANKYPAPLFSEELFSDTRLSQQPTGGVLLHIEDWLAGVQRSSRQKKPLKRNINQNGARYAKQTQFKKCPNNHKPLSNNALQKFTRRALWRANPIQTQNKANSSLSATLQNQNKPNQSQFQTFCWGMSYEENYVL